MTNTTTTSLLSRRHWPLWLVLFVLLELPALPCGPDWAEAVFVKVHGPDLPYDTFAAGHLGVLQPGYRTRHLAIAYNYLTGRPLSADEQRQAVNYNNSLTQSWVETQQAAAAGPPSGFDTWIAARKSFGPVDGYTPTDKLATNRDVPSQSYQSFTNCLDDAFLNATRTLAARSAAHGATSPEVIEWVRGQDSVFTNCGDGVAPRYFGPGTPPPPPPQPRAPAPVPNTAPWLQYDRAYQQAAASFYALDFAAAISRFRAIAADTPSPWSPLARYLVARAMLRQIYLAVSPEQNTSSPTPDAAALAAFNARQDAAYKALQKELQSLCDDAQKNPRLQPLTVPAGQLLDNMNATFQPQQQALVLAARLHGPHRDDFGQSLIDLTYIRTNTAESADSAAQNADSVQQIADSVRQHAALPDTDDKPATAAGADMLDWIETVARLPDSKAAAHALARWRQTHATVWLLAAIMPLQHGDPAAAELIAAATTVPTTDPASISLTYHRLRLSPRAPATRADLLALLPTIDAHETRSTLNLFSGLNAASAPTLADWLKQAGRFPASEYMEGDEDSPPTSFADTGTQSATTTKPPPPQPFFDSDAATILNTRLPLRLLAEAAESPNLAPTLRAQVAQTAWTRAVLLDRPETAHRMTPLLQQAHPAWQPVLAAYNKAANPTDRHAAGLFALMRFASTEPNVRQGYPRPDGFAAYSLYRDNWWCYTIPRTDLDDRDIDTNLLGITTVATVGTPDPPFLTPALRAEANAEVTKLAKVPNASNYFAAQALAWKSARPTDPRTPELLGQALRVERNSCTDKASPELAHQLFLALHLSYPTNHWTKRYQTWE